VWDVEGTNEFADWFGRLNSGDKARVEAAIERLEETGPGLGRPWVDSLAGTRLKELVPRGGYLRILFRFDSRRSGILLIGGDKLRLWDDWYKTMIPLAEKLYEEYLEDLRQEGPLE
jgi:hypothetical protein